MYKYEMIEEFVTNNTINDILANGEKLLTMLRWYNIVFKTPCSTCSKDHLGYYKRLKNEGIRLMKQLETGQFLLKGIIHFNGGEIYSNNNLTDEIAIKILKKNKNYITRFSKFPENWQELLDDEPISPDLIKAGRTSKGNELFWFKDSEGNLKKVMLSTGESNGYIPATEEDLK